MTTGITEHIKRFTYLLAVALLASTFALGQSNTGTIIGQVQDANGAVVANATVTVTNLGTNDVRTVQTNSEGFYEAASLPTGLYKVTAAAGGFQESSVTDIRLAVGDRQRVDVTMAVSGVNAVVTVADQTPVDTETATIGDNIGPSRIQDNPVNGRDFTQLLATVPGSVQTTNQFQTSINGIPSTFGGTSVLVDGIDAGRVDLNGTSNVLGRIESRVNRISMDSIQEIQVLEQSYSAQYGEALSAVINPITKSGTNSFHGSVFDYFRNEGLDANDFFNNAQNLPRSQFRLNQFGGNVSGPIYKDKLFFFTNYEGVRQTRGQLFQALTPTTAFRAGINAALAPAVATLPLPTSPFFRVVNGVPTLDPNLGFFAVQKNGKLREDTGSIKIDWHHTDSSQFSVRYNINDSKTTTPYGVGTDQVADGKLRVQLFKLSHNYAFSGNMVNEAAFGINNNDTNPSAGPSPFPIFSFLFLDSAIANIGPAQFDQIRTGTVYQFLDTLSVIRGDHSVKAGVDIRLNRRSAESRPQTTFQFFSLNDFRTNNPFSVQVGGSPELHYANENFSFFVQDDWKVHPRLSLNLGLRYQVSTVSRERDGLLQNFDPVTLTLSPVGEKIHDADTNNWGPRFGFAFDVFGNQKTVVRGGYGIFYNRELPASFGSPQVNTFPTTSITVLDLLGLGNCPSGLGSIAYPVPASAFNNCGTAARFAIERDLKTPEAQQWSLNVQQDLGVGVLQVGYIGNHVTHLLTDGVVSPRNLNRADIDFFGFNLRRLPQFGDIFLVGSYPSSSYNALQATFKRNLTQGLRFNFNYTWSHAIDNVVGFFRDYQDEFDTNGERASSDQDVRHNFSVDASYDIPSARRWFGDGIPRWIADGWQISTISQFRTGLPVNVTRKGGVFGGFSLRPNLVPGVDPYAPNSARCPQRSFPDCQFNEAAFSSPSGAFTPGNLSRNFLRGPRFAQVDLSIMKNTRLWENTSLQLRMDVFNLFNRANFADPSGGLTVGDTPNSLVPTAFFGRSVSTVGNQLGGLLGFGGPRQIQLSARFNF
jgi:hypothetical protein